MGWLTDERLAKIRRDLFEQYDVEYAIDEDDLKTLLDERDALAATVARVQQVADTTYCLGERMGVEALGACGCVACAFRAALKGEGSDD